MNDKPSSTLPSVSVFFCDHFDVLTLDVSISFGAKHDSIAVLCIVDSSKSPGPPLSAFK